MVDGAKLLVGIDEGGYGPNLGPLVVVAATMVVPPDTPAAGLWDRLRPEVTRYPAADAAALVVDDSKRVYTAGSGLALLERAVLCWFEHAGARPISLRDLWIKHCITCAGDIDDGPWFADRDLALPHATEDESLRGAAETLSAAFRRAGFGPASATCQIIMPRRFNEMIRREGSKATALFQVNAELLRHVWSSSSAAVVDVVFDKHGGRNFYQRLLQLEFPDTLVMTGRESASFSRYSLTMNGRSLQATFLPRADAEFLLVALASMIAKYVRESCMKLFNDYWASHVPQLEPTAGYAVDARRFWRQIRPVARRLRIPTTTLWRKR